MYQALIHPIFYWSQPLVKTLHFSARALVMRENLLVPVAILLRFYNAGILVRHQTAALSVQRILFRLSFKASLPMPDHTIARSLLSASPRDS